MLSDTVVVKRKSPEQVSIPVKGTVWQSGYLHKVVLVDAFCALLAGALAVHLRFESPDYRPTAYLAISLSLPLLWLGVVAMSGGYDARFFGVGSDEFRKVFNAGSTLTAVVAIVCYIIKFDLARGYVAIALPTVTFLDLFARFLLRKRLHAQRQAGAISVQRVVAVGYRDSVAALIAELRRDSHHGLSVVAACLADRAIDNEHADEVADVPVFGGIDATAKAVGTYSANTVAILACPELNGTRLRELTWDLEEWGTEVYVAPALLDVAGPLHHDPPDSGPASPASRPS